MNKKSAVSRRAFLGKVTAATAVAAFPGYSRLLYAQKATITAAEMRADGRKAKITTRPIRKDLSVLMGSGGQHC